MKGRRLPDRDPRLSKRDHRERHWEGQREPSRDDQSLEWFIFADGKARLSNTYPVTPTTVVFGWTPPAELGMADQYDRPASALRTYVRSLALRVRAGVLHDGMVLHGLAVTFRTKPDVAKILLYYPGKCWVGPDEYAAANPTD